MFDFDYIWEVYVPEHKRRWGYYVLPILFGDRLVGRIEPRLDRATRTLRILGIWWEDGFAAPRRGPRCRDARGPAGLRRIRWRALGRVGAAAGGRGSAVWLDNRQQESKEGLMYLADSMAVTTIPVTDLDRALPFYRDVLGLLLEQTPFASLGAATQISTYKRPPVERPHHVPLRGGRH